TLTAQQGGGTYLWSPTGQTTAVITVAPSVITTYTVSSSNGACSDTATITVHTHPVPSASAISNPYTINIGGETTLIGSTSNGIYNWSPSTGLSCSTCPNPIASPTETSTYTLTTIDAFGCAATDTAIVNVKIECGDIFVPSAFSPNADGKNDFVTVRSPCITAIDFVIYNRWGQIVYQTSDVSIVNKSNAGWDGTFNGKPCDPAVFFYILNVDLVSKKFVNKTGSVTLVR
ncbi:MAG TPA: gliding motility-associated C-terminal domain-containing protein, partial [Bacteroidia bacterium]